MAKRLVRKRAADADLAEQVEYIAAQHPEAARRYLSAVEAAFGRLLEMPEIGARCSLRSAKLEGVRVWPVPGFRDFLIFYRVTQQTIQILRILHAARDIPSALGASRRRRSRE